MARPPKLREGQRRADADGRVWIVDGGRWRRETAWETAAAGAQRTLAQIGLTVSPARAPRRSERPAPDRPPLRLPMVPYFIAAGRPARAPQAASRGLLGPSAEAQAPRSAFDVDRQFLAQEEAVGGVPALSMYVPTKNGRVLDSSGPTIGVGVDLGGKNVAYLRSLGLEPELVTALSPYLGLKTGEAQAFVKAHPLTLDREQVKRLDDAVQDEHLNKLVRRFNAESKVGRFDQLPRDTQTAIASLYFQYGVEAPQEAAPNYWGQITTGDWEGAHRNLMDFGDKYGPRRRREAALLGRDLQAGTLPRVAQRRPAS